MTPAPNLHATLAELERAAIEGGMHLAYEETDRTAGCCDIDRIGGVAA
jgi:hypothetical protein